MSDTASAVCQQQLYNFRVPLNGGAVQGRGAVFVDGIFVTYNFGQQVAGNEPMAESFGATCTQRSGW